MLAQSVTVRVPASSANLGTGFDAVGLALSLFADVTLTLHDGSPRRRPEPWRRMVAGAAQAAYKHAEQPPPRGLDIEVESEFPVGRGLGASAAARAGGLVGANALMGGLLNDQTLLQLGTALEGRTDKEGHADNMAPALFGGLQVVALAEDGAGALTVARVAVPISPDLRCAGFTPDFSMPTAQTRPLLPKRLSRADAVHNSSRAALLVAALATGRWDALQVSTDDRLHQPARSKLFPQMYDLFLAATEAGAYCAYLSGGGSTVMALSDSARAEPVSIALAGAADALGLAGRAFVVSPCGRGAEIVTASR